MNVLQPFGEAKQWASGTSLLGAVNLAVEIILLPI